MNSRSARAALIVGVLGLAFKPNTDDIRFAPAIDLVGQLLAEGARICAYDPEAMERARPVLPQVEYAKSAYEAAQDSEALIIARGTSTPSSRTRAAASRACSASLSSRAWR